MQNLIAFDVETTGLKPWLGADMFAYSTCTPEGCINVRRLDGQGAGSPKAARLRLQKLFPRDASRGPALVGHNIKFDLHFAGKALDRDVGGSGRVIHDTMIAAHIIQNDFQDRTLKRLAWELMGYPRDDEKEVKAFVKSGGNFSHVPPELMEVYQRRDAERTMALWLFFEGVLKKNPKWMECYLEEMKLIPVTMKMEARGLQVNRRHAYRLRDRLEEDADAALDAIEDELGERINPASPEKLQWALYEKAGLPVLKRTEKSNQPATDKNVLRELHEQYPENKIISLVLRYRAWKKGAATIQNFLNLCDADDVLHPDILTCGAKTGREACKSPNLQNVQKTGRLLNPFAVPERSVFVPRKGYVNLHVDYSGIELRLIVHYAEDWKMVEAIRTGTDPHAMAAEAFFGDRFLKLKKGSKEWDALRSVAKNANFAIPYGANAKKIAGTLGLSAAEGARAFGRYREAFPGLANINRDVARDAREVGYVITAFGRRINVPEDKAYVALNYLIQGTAADVLKRAQVYADAYCERDWSGRVRLLLPIHDEIIFEYPRDLLPDLPEFLKGLRLEMTRFSEFHVPMDVDFEIVNTNWAEKKGIEL